MKLKLSFLLFLGGLGLLHGGEVFQKPHELVTLKTEHFTFIFAREQQPVAEYLFTQAESLYADVARTLHVPQTLHLPVVLTPDTDDLNGEFSNYPSMRMVCYQAPISPNSGFAYFNDNLKKLFLHELVHAVSLTQTDWFWGFLVALFGDGLYPAPYWAPSNFTEGIAVAFESGDGWGRANDVASAGVIQQAILEDRFPTFLETAGAKGGYPPGISYVYGGWFSRYLRETGGEELYAQLWHEIGRSKNVMDLPLFTGAFRTVYGRSLDSVWEDFRRWMALRVPVHTDLNPVSSELTYVYAVAGSDKLYWADYRGLWTLSQGTPRFLTGLNHFTNRLSVSPDGTKLLISTAIAHGPMAQARLREFDLVRNQFTDRVFPDRLTEAAYLPGGGLVACRITDAGYTTDLVTIENGFTKVWVHGTPLQAASAPSLMDDGRILFLFQKEGEQHLAFLDRQDGSVQVVQTSLAGIRNVSTDGHRVWFSWDNDRTLLKLGVLEDGRVSAYPTMVGGVQFAQGVGDKLYYFASYARGQRLMELPALSAETRPSTLTELESSEVLKPGSFDQKPSFTAQSYNPLPWVLVPQSRFPTLFLDTAAPLSGLVRGAGIGTDSADPAGLFELATRASWLWNDRFADLSVDGVYHGPIDVSLGLFQRLLTDNDPETETDLRQWGGRFGLSDTIEFDLGYSDWQSSATVLRSSGSTVIPLSVAAGFHDLRQTDLLGERIGFELIQVWDGLGLMVPGEVPGVSQTDAGLYLPFFRFHVGTTVVASTNAHLGLSADGPVVDGASWLGAHRFEFPTIYNGNLDRVAPWLVQAQADIGHPFPVGIELPYGFYAESLDLQLGYRAIEFGTYLDAAYFIMALDFRPGLIPILIYAHLSVGLKIEQSFLNSASGPRLSFYFGDSLY